MRRTGVIFRKELVDTFRDRRTIIMMVVVPLVVVPALITILAKVAQRQEERAEAKTIRVAVIGAEHAPGLVAAVAADSQISLVEGVLRENIEQLVRDDSVDGALVIPESFDDRISRDLQATVDIYYRSTASLNITARRLRDIIDEYDERIVSARIQRLNLDEKLFDAVAVRSNDVSTTQEVIGQTVGGFLPYMFVLFCFMGSMYPGIDLGAGEKERGTLETLLSSPASKIEIVLGKFFVVSIIGLSSALISMGGLYLAVTQIADIPPEIMAVVSDILNWKVILMIATLLIPLEVFFAATILGISIYAKSFKEAQSSLTPLNLLVIAPVAVGLMPGIVLSPVTALIPVLNVSLATKDVISGTIDPIHIGLAYLSLLALAGAGLAFCVSWFKRESVLFRE